MNSASSLNTAGSAGQSLASLEGNVLSPNEIANYLNTGAGIRAIESASIKLNHMLQSDEISCAQGFINDLDPNFKPTLIKAALINYLRETKSVDTNLLDFFISNGANLEKTCIDGRSVFESVLLKNADIDTLKYVQARGADPRLRTANGVFTTLDIAFACKASPDVIRYIIESGVSPAHSHPYKGVSTLQVALKYNASLETIELLLSRPDVINANHGRWEHCLASALESKAPYEVFKLIADRVLELDNKVSAKDINSSRFYPIEGALLNPDLRVLKYVVERGGHAQVLSSDKESLLEFAVGLKHVTPETVDIIINAKPGWLSYVSPLKWLDNSPVDLFKNRKLLDVNYVNPRTGKSILQTAREHNAPEAVIDKLIQLGARTDHVN